MESRVLQEALELLEAKEQETTRLTEPRVAYLGPEYSHSYEAASQAFPHGRLVPCSNFRSIFERLYEGETDYGLVPIQNSIGGSVFEPLSELFEWTDKNPARRIVAFGDFSMRIRNFIATKQVIALPRIRVIYTKDEAHRQCAEWLIRNNLDQHVEHVGSTSQAAEQVSKMDGPDVAVICALSAVNHFGLQCVVPQPITDDPTNTTRFLKLKLAKTAMQASTADGQRVTLLFLVLRDVPGALYRVLGVFAREGHNLRDITKAPLRQKQRISPEFKDWFLLEYEADGLDGGFLRALQRLERRKELQHVVKVVGSFATDQESRA